MGFSTSGAMAIIFVGILIAVGIAYPTLEAAVDRRSTAIDDRDQRALDVRNTDVDVTEATYDDSGTDPLLVNATNTGSTTLSVPEIDLLVDGTYLGADGYTAAVEDVDDRELWQPGETLTLRVHETDEPTRVKVVTGNGVAETVTDVEVA